MMSKVTVTDVGYSSITKCGTINYKGFNAVAVLMA